MIAALILLAISATPAHAAPPVEITLPTMTTPGLPAQFTIPITIDDVTGDNINSYQFNILYNSTVINPDGDINNNFGCDTTGTLTGTAAMTVVCNVPSPGVLRVVAFDTPPFLTGMGTLLKLNFLVSPTAVPGNMSALTFDVGPPSTVRFFNSGGMQLANVPTNGSVTITGPTSAPAAVSGRVTTADGRGITNAVVNITDAQGTTRSARTSAFGYYRLDGVETGATYVMSVTSKRYQFQPRTVTVSEEAANVDFVAQPEN